MPTVLELRRRHWRGGIDDISRVTGVHDVYPTFASGQPADLVNVHWFTFAP